MSDLIELNLPTVRDYLLDVLADEAGLCAPMRDIVSREGDVYALVPASTSVERAEQFNAGGLTEMAGSEDAFVKRLAARHGVLIVQDSFAPVSRYENNRTLAHVWVHKEIVYLWTDLSPENADAIRSCWRVPMSWEYFGFVIDDPAAAQKLGDETTSLQELADRVTELYVPAYDQESFVIWTR